jgi:NAD+ synthase (glutamine-hydrolysing)
VVAYTLPGFATSEATKANAWSLIRALGATGAEIDIRPAARQMLSDLNHPFARGEPIYDITFENVQAGLRTDYLFRLANQHNALVVGTGDLSELALGWCTYGVGDQMSHYNVNASVAKTLIQHLIRFVARSGEVDEETSRVLEAILRTENFAGTDTNTNGRNHSVQRESDRSLRAAGLQSLLFDTVRVSTIEDCLPRVSRMG